MVEYTLDKSIARWTRDASKRARGNRKRFRFPRVSTTHSTRNDNAAEPLLLRPLRASSRSAAPWENDESNTASHQPRARKQPRTC